MNVDVKAAPKAEAAPEDREIVPIHDWIYASTLWSYKQFFRLFGWRVRGLENVPPTGAVIIAPNHVSMFDPPLVGCATPRAVTTMGKAELFEKRTFGIKLLGFIIQHMGTFPVRRGVADRRAIKRAKLVLQSGGALVIFPEGTRTKTGELGAPELGLAMLAHANKAPIVPTYIAGTEGGLSNLQPKFRPVRVAITYGKPLYFEEEYARRGNRETLQTIADRVMQEIAALRDVSNPNWRWPDSSASNSTQVQSTRATKAATPESNPNETPRV